jgi:hypothetical protein
MKIREGDGRRGKERERRGEKTELFLCALFLSTAAASPLRLSTLIDIQHPFKLRTQTSFGAPVDGYTPGRRVG